MVSNQRVSGSSPLGVYAPWQSIMFKKIVSLIVTDMSGLSLFAAKGLN